MSSLTTIKNLLNNRFSGGGRSKLQAITNPNVDRYPQRGILLFYVNNSTESSVIALGRKTQIGLYSQAIQVAVVYDDYDKARDISFQILEFINSNMPTGITMIPDTMPYYAGVNGSRGQHIYVIDYIMKGDK